MNNKVFYQHPNLMRILGMHETVMEVMVNVLGGDKSQVCPHLTCKCRQVRILMIPTKEPVDLCESLLCTPCQNCYQKLLN